MESDGGLAEILEKSCEYRNVKINGYAIVCATGSCLKAKRGEILSVYRGKKSKISQLHNLWKMFR